VTTLHGAYPSYEERLKGSLESGKLADLVVLGRDPLQEDPFSLISIPIERTMVGGAGSTSPDRPVPIMEPMLCRQPLSSVLPALLDSLLQES
jgi:hypothetical protein